MKRNIAKRLTTSLLSYLLLALTAHAANLCPQQKPIHIDKKIIKQLAALKPSSANASEVEQLFGPPCSCLTMSAPSAESWLCQWKGDLSSNSIANMLNVQFVAGVITGATVVTSDGVTYMMESGGKIQTYRMN